MEAKDFINRHYGPREGRVRPYSVYLELTHRCNFNCVHCYIPRKGPLPEEMNVDDYKRLADQLSDAGVMSIVFTGGEPLVREDFAEIYTCFAEKGFKLHLMTNGYALEDHHFELFREWPLKDVEVSLYGMTAPVFQAYTQTRFDPERVPANVRRLVEEKIPVRLKTVALKQNAAEINACRAFSDLLGVTFRYEAVVHQRLDCDSAPCDHQMAMEQTLELDRDRYQALMKPGGKFKPLRISRPNPVRKRFQCGMAKNIFLVAPDGAVHPCLLVRSGKWNLRERPVGEIFSEEYGYYSNLHRSYPVECDACTMKMSCSFCEALLVVNREKTDHVGRYCEIARQRVKLREEVFA